MISKIKAWHHELKRMMSIKNMYFEGGVLEELELNDAVMNDYITVSPSEVTLLHSMELRDKNNREIFEGDIITNGKEVMCIKHNNILGFYLEQEDKVQFIAEDVDFEVLDEFVELLETTVEIIGNMFETPELIGL